MQKMCYEQLLKFLFKTKRNQTKNIKTNDQKYVNNTMNSKQLINLQMNPVYDHFRKYVESDESCSSSNTYVETLESDPNTIYSCQHCSVIYKSSCNNCLHNSDLKTVHKPRPDFSTPQQVSKTTKICLPPHVHRSSSHRKVLNKNRPTIFNNSNLLNFSKLSTDENDAKYPQLNEFSSLSYHLTKTFHSPPNRNPFDLSEAHF